MRNIDWEQDQTGRVYLIKEKTRNRFLKKIIDMFHKSQYFHIHLDELGTSAWLLIDGKKSVNEICRQMKEEFGERLHQAEGRVSFFFAMLKKNKFVDFRGQHTGPKG